MFFRWHGRQLITIYYPEEALVARFPTEASRSGWPALSTTSQTAVGENLAYFSS